MKDEIQLLNEKIEALEKELQTAKQLALLEIQAGIWKHSLEKSVMTIGDNASLIKSYLKKKGNVQKIEDCLNRITRSVDRILKMPVVSPPSIFDVPIIQIDEFLNEHKSQLQENYKEIQIIVESEPMPHTAVRVHPEWLSRCLDILVENSVYAMQDSPKKILYFAIRTHKGVLEISMSDTGNGIPESVQQRLFKEPIKVSDKQRGFGYGLLMAQAIIQAFNGQIELKNTSDKGTEFVISLPTEAKRQREEIFL